MLHMFFLIVKIPKKRLGFFLLISVGKKICFPEKRNLKKKFTMTHLWVCSNEDYSIKLIFAVKNPMEEFEFNGA